MCLYPGGQWLLHFWLVPCLPWDGGAFLSLRYYSPLKLAHNLLPDAPRSLAISIFRDNVSGTRVSSWGGVKLVQSSLRNEKGERGEGAGLNSFCCPLPSVLPPLPFLISLCLSLSLPVSVSFYVCIHLYLYALPLPVSISVSLYCSPHFSPSITVSVSSACVSP